MGKVLVGMSGGVDSAVAAYLLKEQGYEVIGVTLRTWLSENGENRCCEIDDARRICHFLKIPYYPLNCASVFREAVIEPFIDAYLAGKTPNPCVECNRYVKWDRLTYYAKVFGADRVTTGHYANVVRLDNGRYTVRKAKDPEKDQTYMLYKLTQEQLARTLLPLGGLLKAEVREIAEQAGLRVAKKPDSQDICFVTDGNYADYIRAHAAGDIPGEGSFTDERGNVLGRHRGIIHYTVGQRKGLGVACGRPVYVKRIDPARNEVVLAGREAVDVREISCGRLHFLSIDAPKAGTAIPCFVKVRYHQKPQKAELRITGGDGARVVFDAAVRLPAPGQSAVFYDENECVIGGGIIDF